jgi:hypothetical protein
MTKLGSELIFINHIGRDGKKLNPVPVKDTEFLNKQRFKLIPLSLAYETFIASNLNLFIVKIK